MFRDESSHVIKRVQAKERRRRAATAQNQESRSSGEESTVSPSSSSPSMTGEPLPTPATPVVRAQKTLPTTLTLLPAHGRGEAGPSQGQSEGQSQAGVVDPQEVSTSPPASWTLVPSLARMYNLTPAFQERGTAFFFSRYVTVDGNALHQRFDFIFDIWKPGSAQAAGQMDSVMASMTAVGLAGLAQLTHSDECVASARKSYGTALRLTNTALRDPAEAVKDTTMLSVLILGVFEMMAGPSVKTMQAWDKHISGAVVLAKLRGPGQLRTAVGIRMFNLLVQSVMIACIQKHAAVPPELIAFQGELFSAAGTDDPSRGFSRVALTRPVFRMLQLRHDMHGGLVHGLDQTLDRLQAIITECAHTVASFPPGSVYRVLRVLRPHPAVFRGRCHVYRNSAIASIWNLLRFSYLLVLESVLTAIQRRWPDAGESGEPVPLAYLACYLKTCEQLEQVADDIVASVPQNLELLRTVSPYFDTLGPLDTPVTLASLPRTEVVRKATQVRTQAQSRAQASASASASPASTPSTSSPSDSDAHSSSADETVFDDCGPSIENLTRARTPEEDVERLLLLASSPNGLVWPLFCVGTSTVCTPPLKTYVVERLQALGEERGLRQAHTVAAIVRNRVMIKSPWHNIRRNAAHDPPQPPTESPGGPAGPAGGVTKTNDENDGT